MEKVLEMIDNVLNSSAETTLYTDAFTNAVMELILTKKNLSLNNYTAGSWSDIDENTSYEAFKNILPNEKLFAEYHTTLQDFESIEGINTDNHSLLSIVWAVVIFHHIKEKTYYPSEKTINDIYESIPFNIKASLKKDINPTDLMKEVYDIFKNTEFKNKIGAYFIIPYQKNINWHYYVNKLHENWFDVTDSFKNIAVSPTTLDKVSLKQAFSSPDINFFASIKNLICGKNLFSKEDLLNGYIGASAKSTFQDNTASLTDLEKEYISVKSLLYCFKNKEFIDKFVQESSEEQLLNVTANLILQYYVLDNYLSKNLKDQNSSRDQKKISTFIAALAQEANIISNEILRDLGLITETVVEDDPQGPFTDDSGENDTGNDGNSAGGQSDSGQNAGIIKTTNSKLKYLESFLASKILFAPADKALGKLESKINKLDKNNNYSISKKTLIAIDTRLSTTITQDQSKEGIRNDILAYIRNLNSTLSHIAPLYINETFKRFISETGNNIIQFNLDDEIIKKFTSHPEKAQVIIEYFALLESDPILKSTSPAYRLLPNEKLKRIYLKRLLDSATQNSVNSQGNNTSAGGLQGPVTFKYLPILFNIIQKPSEEEEMELKAYELYVNIDGTTNEECKVLYDILSKSSKQKTDNWENTIIQEIGKIKNSISSNKFQFKDADQFSRLRELENQINFIIKSKEDKLNNAKLKERAVMLKDNDLYKDLYVALTSDDLPYDEKIAIIENAVIEGQIDIFIKNNLLGIQPVQLSISDISDESGNGN